MGITFLAAGTSVPEAVSSVIVAKQGENRFPVLNPFPVRKKIKKKIKLRNKTVIRYLESVVISTAEAFARKIRFIEIYQSDNRLSN